MKAKILLPFVVAIIHRDMAEKIPKEVFMHELPILEQVHGKTVVIDHDAQATQPPREVDPIEEFERMVRKYGDDPKAGIPYVERIYGRPIEFARALENLADQSDDMAGGAAQEPAGSQLDPMTAELDGLTKAQLLKVADMLDIPGTSGMNKADLVANIQEKRTVLLEDSGHSQV